MSRRYDPHQGFVLLVQGDQRQEPYPRRPPPPPLHDPRSLRRDAPPIPPPHQPSGYTSPSYPYEAHPHSPHRALWAEAPGWPSAPAYTRQRRYPDVLPLPLADGTLRESPTRPGYQHLPTAQQLAEPFNASPFPSNYGPRTRRRPKEQARAACANCKRDHVSCDNNRPCRRCQSAHKESTCEDVPPKKRGRPKVRIDRDSNNSSTAQSSSNSERTSAWMPTDQTTIPNKDEQDEPEQKAKATRREAPLARYPPSSYVAPRNQGSPTLSAGQTSAGSQPLALLKSPNGPGPAPTAYAPLAPSNTSPTRSSYGHDYRDSRSSASLDTPPAVPPHAFQFGGMAASLVPQDPYNAPAPASGQYPAYPFPNGPPPALYYDARSHAPVYDPPYQIPAQGRQPVQRLPPLSSLGHILPATSIGSEARFQVAPSVSPRRRLSNTTRSHRYSWHEQSRPVSMYASSTRPISSSASDAPAARRRSLDLSCGNTTPVRPMRGTRRPSEGPADEEEEDGRRKRTRLTLDDVMRPNDE